MAGQITKMLQSIIQQRANGNSLLVTTTTTKLIMKGLNPNKFTSASPDDPQIIARVKAVAIELGIRI